jgi:hypothetical protein
MNKNISLLVAAALSAGFAGTLLAQAQPAANAMTFFITSVGKGDGANLGGLAGADMHCAALAKAAGSTRANWRAYLSTTAVTGANPVPGVDARDRIGSGPWVNARGVTIARNLDELHSAAGNLTKQSLLNEKGQLVNGRGDTPNTHDILTGSDSGGRFLPIATTDTTCRNWTSNGEGAAVVGHHDGPNPTATRPFTGWNSAHMSRSCSQVDLVATGGAGQFYCFSPN